MAARRHDFPHLISSCFSRAPVRDSSFLLAKLLVLQLPNSFNENALGYLKHVKDFAAQDDFDWNLEHIPTNSSTGISDRTETW